MLFRFRFESKLWGQKLLFTENLNLKGKNLLAYCEKQAMVSISCYTCEGNGHLLIEKYKDYWTQETDTLLEVSSQEVQDRLR